MRNQGFNIDLKRKDKTQITRINNPQLYIGLVQPLNSFTFRNVHFRYILRTNNGAWI